MSSKRKPSTHTPSPPPGPPPQKGLPFYVAVAGRKGRRGDHAGKGITNTLQRGG